MIFHPSQRGILLAISAFTLWGLFPFYFKALSHVGSFVVLANRVIWAAVALFFIIFFIRRYWSAVFQVLRDKNQMCCLLLTSVLIAFNWGAYIWAVDNNKLLEASLGYYINPLFNILLGMLLLKERLNRWQTAALILAAIAVSIQVVMLSSIPWIALGLALSFSLYGYVHKKIAVSAIPGLFVESCILLPFALIYLYLQFKGEFFEVGKEFTVHYKDYLLLIGAGIVTIIPLLLFTMATKRIAYSIVGFIQYITPSLLFLIGIFYYKEAFSIVTLITFLIIWLALFMLSADMIKSHKAEKKLPLI